MAKDNTAKVKRNTKGHNEYVLTYTGTEGKLRTILNALEDHGTTLAREIVPVLRSAMRESGMEFPEPEDNNQT